MTSRNGNPNDRTRRALPILPAVGALLLGGAAAAQEEDGDDGAAEDAGLPELEPIQAELAEIRKLEFRRDVPAARQSLEDFGAYVDRELDEVLPAERRDGIMTGLVRLGMLEERMDLAGELRDALLSQAGAYYDPVDDRFYYLMTDLPDMVLDTIAAHELVHALQDQHLGLEELMEATSAPEEDRPRNDDRSLAARFLVEGDATFTMMLHQLQSMGMDPDPGSKVARRMIDAQAGMSLDQLVAMSRSMKGMLGEDNAMARAADAMEDIPAYVMEPLLAAYMKGARFALEVQQDGGWEALNAAYAAPPASTEQALHPEKYLAAERDDPTPIELPGLLGVTDEGWERLDAAVHGELYLRLLLANLGAEPDVAEAAAAGWDGDVYAAWRGPDGETLVALVTVWDTVEDAVEFHDAYRALLPSRYPDLEELASGALGGTKASDSEHLRYACGDDLGHGTLARIDNKVVVVEGGSEKTAFGVNFQLVTMEIELVR